MSEKKNLVMGLVKGYNWYLCEPFVRSFIKYVKNSDMVIILDDVSDFTRHKFEEVKKEFKTGELKLVPFEEKFKSAGHPASVRWKAFLEYIEKNGVEYNQILLADTKDVFFQADFFESFSKYEEYAGITYFSDNQTLGYSLVKNPTIWQWFVKAFGEEEAEKFFDRRTFCPSTVWGTAKELEIFLKVVCENIPNYDIFGTDECTFDYVLYHNMVPVKNIVEISGETSEILHLNWLNQTHRIQIDGEFVLNTVGVIPDVVHYFDRNVLLLNLSDRLYRSKDCHFDENFSDQRSILDQLPHLVFAGQYGEALKIFTDHLLNKANFNVMFHRKDQETLKNMDFTALTEEDKKVLKNIEIRGYGDVIIRMWEVMIEANLPATDDGEFLELAIQRALMNSFDKVIPLGRAEKIVACIKVAESKGHSVNMDFKKFVLQKLFERATIFIDDVSIAKYLSCMELVSDLKLPLDEKWRHLKNKAYAMFGFLAGIVYNDEEMLKETKQQYEHIGISYRTYRIDADFENGGLK